MRAVVDTNVIVSGLNFPGNERDVLDLARQGAFDLCVSRFILQEAGGVLQRKFGWSKERTEEATRLLQSWATVVEPRERVHAVRRNEADNRILECALEAQGDFLVTGDKRDLLPLKQFRGVRIVNSAEFLALVGGK